MPEPRVLVGSAAAENLLGIKRSRLHALVNKGELVPVLRMAGALVFDLQDVHALAAKRRIEAGRDWRVKTPPAAP